MKSIGLVIGAAVLATAFIAPPRAAIAGKKLDAKQKLAWNAAQALYGKGLKIKRSKKAVTIKPGTLTQERFDSYVKDVYLPHLMRVSVSHSGEPARWNPTYRDKKWNLRGATKFAYILLEPAYKFALCKVIADQIGFTPNMEAHAKRKSWCAHQAMIEAFSPVYEFRGTAVTWKGSRDRGDLKIDEEIFKADASGHYPILVTVAGGRQLITKPGITIATKMTRALNSDMAPALYRKANRYWKGKVKAYHKVEKRMLAKQYKLARGKVLFSEKSFYDWIALPGAKGTISCNKSYTLAYAPKRGRKDGYHLSFKIDGIECMALPLTAKERDANAFHHTTTCRTMFKKGTTHTLSVDLHKDIITGSHSRKELDKRDYRIKSRTYNLSKRGKKLYGASIKCLAD